MDILFILDWKSFYKGSVVNRALSFLHGGSLETMLTAYLYYIYYCHRKNETVKISSFVPSSKIF